MLPQQGYRGRFAPSPTGALHLGNLRTALISWLRARLAAGEWLLRVDDLDTPRNRSGAVESLQADLHWLGLDWDGPMLLQSDRLDLYLAVLEDLRLQGYLYACRCSRRQLIANTADDSPLLIYPGRCRGLQLGWDPWEGRWPSWRLRVAEAFAQSSGDVVVRRADGFIAYHLATVVDELTLGITEVVRGADLAVALPAQLAVLSALTTNKRIENTRTESNMAANGLVAATPAGRTPAYRHVPLLCDADGRKLAKRDGGLSLHSLRERGLIPSQVVGLLAAGLQLVPDGTELSAAQLLQDLSARPQSLEMLLSP